MRPTVSIIIPVYNSEEYLEGTLKSVIGQTYSKIEVVIVDDGSTDKSGLICDEYVVKDKRIAVYHTENQGPSMARNYAISMSKGEYILPVDSDDIIAPKYVEHAVEVLDNNAEIGIVYCRAHLFGNESGEWNLRSFSVKEILIGNCIFASSMFRRKDFERVGGYYEGMKYGLEDYDLWLSLIEMGKKVYQIPSVLFYYRKHSGSRTELFESSSDLINETDATKYIRHKRLFEDMYNVMQEDNKVVLYGAGGAGRTYYNYLKSLGNNSIKLWVDKNYNQAKKLVCDADIYEPDRMFQNNYDNVVIAINNLDDFLRIKEGIIEKGYSKDKIFWYLRNDL